MRGSALSALVGLCVLMVPVAPAAAQDEVKGAAILEHPAGKLAITTAGLLQAGKIDEAIRLRSPQDQAEWKKEPAAERQDTGARMKARAPDPAALAEAIRKGGVLNVFPARAILEVPYAGGSVVGIFNTEGGKWFVTTGPMVMSGGGPAAKETRLEGADIEKHPVYELALRYADALHTGPVGGFISLATAEAQARWKAEPASERAASTAFRKKMVPTRAALADGIRNGGVLIIEDDSRATLNVITRAQTPSAPGTVDASSTTVAMPFVFENGVWKLGQ